MNILAYLHEDIEPKIIHGGLKSSNILLDNQWNPKISDAALTAGLLNPHSGLEDYSLTSLMHDEKSDVHNFGVLVMEIVTGKPPVIDCGDSPVYLVDWLKSMVASKKIEQVVDPTLSDQTINLLELKRIILIALRCVVAEVEHRPKMKDIIHMLEPLDLLLNDTKACNKRKDSSNNDRHDGQVEGAYKVHLEEEAAITRMKKM
ncbi:hypothetical protein SLEP1_g3422 [Rubroshorea leprosula]|uniref:non-specific serine/threonine protein kinase n=1 Tax=Rubroshorea leprosula TaxID=152421 RepID=A0AAV5HKF1_9ROSI|nr:hypothetical protein SLEP1_g3422 [Rubroshorea leprosula]